MADVKEIRKMKEKIESWDTQDTIGTCATGSGIERTGKEREEEKRDRRN